MFVLIFHFSYNAKAYKPTLRNAFENQIYTKMHSLTEQQEIGRVWKKSNKFTQINEMTK